VPASLTALTEVFEGKQESKFFLKFIIMCAIIAVILFLISNSVEVCGVQDVTVFCFYEYCHNCITI
jgi:hypothetical protein